MSRRSSRSLLASTALLGSLAMLALPEHTQAVCLFEANSPALRTTFRAEYGSFTVPRDAPVGTLIGRFEKLIYSDPMGNATCVIESNRDTWARITPTRPFYPGKLGNVGGYDVDGKVLYTNVPGVGVYIKLGEIYNGVPNNSFRSADGTDTLPYYGILTELDIGTRIGHMLGETLLIKIGDIPPGPNAIDVQLMTGAYVDLGEIMSYTGVGTVTGAQCSLKNDYVSADPVELGDYQTGDFKGIGHTTAPVPFHITLSDCYDSSEPGAPRTDVNITLDGVNGSQVIDAANGVFSLSTPSGAEGIGIRLLRADGTPMRLQSKEYMQNIEVGETRLNFQAQYIQTQARVKPGVAQGALKFTLTYR